MDLLIFRALALLGLAILVAIAARRLKLPYTVGLVLAGSALAAARVDAGVALTHDLIFDVVLPPLLFEAALNLHWTEMRRELVPVLALSTVGVLMCAGVVATGLIYGLGWPVEAALVLGALISATDPIAVIALLREAGATGRLRLLIEAESLVNDGTAAVLFTAILAWAAHDPAESAGPFSTALAFVTIAGGGVLVGLAVGFAATLLAGRSDDRLVATAVSGVAAYCSFLLAERLHGSGVLATVVAGVVMGNLGVLRERAIFGRKFSPEERTFVLELWEFAAFLANSLVFLLIGSALAGVDFAREGAFTLVLAILLALVGRAAAVYPVMLAFRATRWRTPLAEQHLMWWGGLRGALALALALALPYDLPYREDILIVAFAVVAFSIVVQGLTAPFVIRALGLKGAD